MPGADENGGHPAIELAQMLQQKEVRCAEDDWTGLTNAAERRKLQNRLNQRIYRRRRGAKPERPKSKSDNNPKVMILSQETQKSGISRGTVAVVEPVIEIQDENDSPRNTNSTPSSSPESLTTKRWSPVRGSRWMSQAQLEATAAKFEALARRDYMLGSPRTDQLLTLIQFNVFRALISNTFTMGWTLEWLECTDPISPWNLLLLPEHISPPCPLALRPTHAQQTVEHHPWIDLWPIPKMRDNILLAGDSYDEDQLCNDLVEFENIPNEQTGLIVWSEPWDPAGWEVSETFLRNWGWTVKGCVELLRSTNYWRARRGENPLVFEV